MRFLCVKGHVCVFSGLKAICLGEKIPRETRSDQTRLEYTWPNETSNKFQAQFRLQTNGPLPFHSISYLMRNPYHDTRTSMKLRLTEMKSRRIQGKFAKGCAVCARSYSHLKVAAVEKAWEDQADSAWRSAGGPLMRCRRSRKRGPLDLWGRPVKFLNRWGSRGPLDPDCSAAGSYWW